MLTFLGTCFAFLLLIAVVCGLFNIYLWLLGWKNGDRQLMVAVIYCVLAGITLINLSWRAVF